MVKGVTRQVIVIKGPDPKLFEEAIFLVRNNALSDNGITEEALLREARKACRNAGATEKPLSMVHKLLWSAAGAAVTGCIWTLLAVL